MQLLQLAIGAALISISQCLAMSQVQYCTAISKNQRVDCWPEQNGATPEACKARGCCWEAASQNFPDSVPYCFYPIGYGLYKVTSSSASYTSQQISISKKTKSAWPRDYDQLFVQVKRHNQQILRVTVADGANSNRWQPPLPLSRSDGGSLARADLRAETPSSIGDSFFVNISRRADGSRLFDTSSTFGPLIFSDQFLQISVGLEAEVVYGLGEHLGPFAKPLNQWKRLVLWNHDSPPVTRHNLYGSHNFLVAMSKGGSAFGIFLLNSNAQEVVLQPKVGTTATVTYRSIGGILDFFVFAGPSPESVVAQYRSLIGQPIMPPLWSLGYHLCRFGFSSIDRLRSVYERNVNIGVPIDVMWADIDYMEAFKDWTFDAEKFAALPNFVKQLRSKNRNFVVIIDPGIKIEDGYPAYELGKKAGIFMRTSDNASLIVGKVWPGDVVWPDFTNPAAQQWWEASAAQFLKSVPVSGLWIDMNEPSNFYQGSKDGCAANSSLDHPPYLPQLLGEQVIYTQTVCPSALQHLGSHYDLHNMYAYFEAKATWQLLRNRDRGAGISNRRQFVLSRSSFPGIQRYSFHWTGDNAADWYNLRYSLSTILNFNLFGMVNTGSDVCGFDTATTEELCIRWTQLGAFYPFMRNHNSINLPDQDPAAFSVKAQAIMRAYIKLRYSLMPYIYTQFYFASANGTTVARSMMEAFHTDSNTWDIDDQFLFGSSLMVCPVTEKGSATRKVYFPPSERWYEVNYAARTEVKQLGTQTVPAPIDVMPLYFRGGSVIVLQSPGNDTYHQRRLNPFLLTVALNSQLRASGSLFWDNEGDRDISEGDFQLMEFNAAGSQLVSKLLRSTEIKTQMRLASVEIIGLRSKPNHVSVNGISRSFQFAAGRLVIGGQSALRNVDLRRPLSVMWD